MKRGKQAERDLVSYLTEHYFKSADQAQNAVKLGIVNLNGKVVKRAGIIINEDQDRIEVVGGGKIFVSRGGYKLQKGLELFEVKLGDRICLDIGSSTGGFTDCMLQYGAREVYAIDTGYGQLAWELRINPAVHCIERMNVRFLMPEKLYPELDTPKATFCAVDVSFISVIKIIPSLQRLVYGPDKAEFVILIKSQFEAGKNQVGKGGIVRNPGIHLEILMEFVSSCQRAGIDIKQLSHSPLLGSAGNIEFLAHATWPKAGPSLKPHLKEWLTRIVEGAYRELAPEILK
ncbi:MAG: TlyA family RNA methyltransferase [Candidatus Caenarcaniphilales bacterium]|nr:TlyA family RNA methyltransferase [Candidatus Caenarcaniphilales bacterium]